GDVAQIQGVEERLEVGGEGVVVVSSSRLAGLAKPAPVIGDNAAPLLQQRRDLLIPGAATQWKAMNQDDWPSGAVVFIVQVDCASVLLADRDVRHRFLLFCSAVQMCSGNVAMALGACSARRPTSPSVTSWCAVARGRGTR